MWNERLAKPVVGGTLRRNLGIQATPFSHRRPGLTSDRTGARSSWNQRNLSFALNTNGDPSHRSSRKKDVPASAHLFHLTIRNFAASSQTILSTSAPILPSSEKFEPPQSSGNPDRQSPIIILHGLFGSKQNWRSLAKRLSQASLKTVYTLDLRNHGESQATPGFTSYLDYASDVKHFITTNNLRKVILIGHSMGGKVAMTLALESSIRPDEGDSELINKLIAVDISPAKGPISKSFQVYVDGFKEINSSFVSSRKQADEILTKYESDLGRRQFLLTNLKPVERAADEGGGTKFEIRLPVEVLEAQLSNNHVGDFPFEFSPSPASTTGSTTTDQAGTVRFEKPALFIKGARSKYINKHNIPAIDAFFKNYKLVILDTDHWVHAEKPNEFIQTVVDFLQE